MSAALLGFAGCSSILRRTESTEPVTIGRLLLENASDEPNTISVLLTTPETIVYWGQHELDGTERPIAPSTTVDGPWDSNGAELELFVRLGDATAEELSTDTDDVARVTLGERVRGCLEARVSINATGNIYISEQERDEFC